MSNELANSHRPPEMGLGAVTFGREIDEMSSFAMMDYAMAHDICFFDTAAAYGNGASESIIGRWLARRPPGAPRPTVATKILPPFTPEAVKSNIAQCQARLGQSRIDQLLLHRWDQTVCDDRLLATLSELVANGTVMAVGVSNFSLAQLELALQQQERGGFVRFGYLQNIHNVAVRGFEGPIRALCRANQVRMIGYSPLGAGFLTGKHREGTVPGSRFDLVPAHHAIYGTESSRRRSAALQAIATRQQRSLVELALVWALQPGGIDTVLIGGRRHEHIDQALFAARLHEPDIIRELDAA